MGHSFEIHERAGFRYVDEGPNSDVPPVVLLHGMLGDHSNWAETIKFLSEKQYRVIVPLIPVYNLPLRESSVSGLAAYVHRFVAAIGIRKMVLAGNSLGGHIALLYTIQHPDTVSALVLCGASGIYEVEMGTSMLRRKDRDELRRRAAFTFYDPAHATEALVDEVYEIVNDRNSAVRLIRMARAVQAESVAKRLGEIVPPTLLVWGLNDRITPPDVAEEFNRGIADSRLHFIDECGHAAMLEQPNQFNRHMLDFLHEIVGIPEMSLSG